MHVSKKFLMAIPLLLASAIAVAGTTVASCPTASPGAVWPTGSWLPCSAAIAYIAEPVAPTAVVNDMRCRAGAACVFTWQQASAVLPTDQVWVETAAVPKGAWVAGNTLAITPVVPPPPPAPPPSPPPSPPPVSGVTTFTLSSGTITINWTPPLTNVDGTAIAAGEITGYNVYENTGVPITLGTPLNPSPVAAGTLAYAVSSVPAGTYYFSVVAVAANSQSSPLTGSVMVIPTITVSVSAAPNNFGIIAIATNSQSVGASVPAPAPSAIVTPNPPATVTVTYSSEST